MGRDVLIPVADGIEEIEAVCIIDILRRAGAAVTIAGVQGLEVAGSHGIRLVADRRLADCIGSEYDLVALPGGMPGAEHLRDSKELTSLLKRQREEGRLYAAICASPAIVFQGPGLLEGRKATAHPLFLAPLTRGQGLEGRVLPDGNCVTSRGPGTAIEFALKLVELLYGEEMAGEIARSMLVP